MDGVTKNYTTLKIASEETPAFGYKYAYDELGNISAVYEGVKGTNGNYSYSNTPTVSYVYDANGQLTHVNDFVNNEQYEYVYNSAGNITRRYHYSMNSDWQPASTLESIRYTYADTNGWKDLMTKYNGQTITYDAIGNPLSYRDGISLTWQNGRELASFTNADTSVSYTYDASGMRTSKTLTSDGATDTVKYVYENGLLLQMQYNHMYFDFIYDANGNPVSMAYRSTAASSPIYYYYGLNSRGDVVALYYNTGTIAARYSYDAYGKLLSVTTSSGSPINTKYSPAKLNPLRYRGYVYDTETELYYLQSRYYDPATCRFINEDIYCDTGIGLTGLNMFSYCNNNPVMCCDYSGKRLVVGTTLEDETSYEVALAVAYENKPLDITEKLCDEMYNNSKDFELYRMENGLVKAAVYFATKEFTGGEWDLKNREDWNLTRNRFYIFDDDYFMFDDIGNIHYGYVGRAVYSTNTLLLTAGAIQIISFTSKFEYRNTFFDDPRDQEAIMYGCNLWDEGVIIWPEVWSARH